jgi:hypothetical protein
MGSHSPRRRGTTPRAGASIVGRVARWPADAERGPHASQGACCQVSRQAGARFQGSGADRTVHDVPPPRSGPTTPALESARAADRGRRSHPSYFADPPPSLGCPRSPPHNKVRCMIRRGLLKSSEPTSSSAAPSEHFSKPRLNVGLALLHPSTCTKVAPTPSSPRASVCSTGCIGATPSVSGGACRCKRRRPPRLGSTHRR